ncbi:MAG: BON domain-containing protein [Nitrospiraceae bacterium]|nr:MAG: BON domain-containing protein [Nitrospiraceae bacterium]
MDALLWDSRVEASGIIVEAIGGKIRLSGFVPYLTTRLIAEEIANSVPGVLSVINELDVRSPEPAAADKEIQTYIKKVLSRHSSIDATRFDVMAKEGIVSIKGTVPSYWDKIKAEEFISSVTGVREIINELAVVPTTDYADELIAKRIIDNLEHNIYTSAETVTVKVDKGHVTLSGSLPSPGQKISAYNIVRYVKGVKSIQNLITVDNVPPDNQI